MARRLRIGVLTHNYPIRSKERKDAGIFIYDFCQELSKKNDVFVFCPDFGGKKETYKKIPVTWFSWGGSGEKLGSWKLYNPIDVYKFFKLILIGQKKAIKFVKDNKLDYCLSCWALPSSLFGLRVHQTLKIPYASWSLGSDINKYSKIPILSRLIILSLKNADKLYANSYALCRQVANISGKKCFFLPAITSFDTKHKSTKNKCNIFRFLYVGRLEKVKGGDILIEAIKLLSKSGNKFVVDILGDGTMRGELEKGAVKFKKKVIFHGWADEDKVAAFMQNSDCLVVPSRNESMPLVIIEAAKKYLPVIATDVGDCRRVIQKYKIGIWVNKESPFLLSKAMKKMMNNKKYKERYFNKLNQDFSQENAVNLFISKIK